MRCPKRIYNPVTAILTVGNQGTDANDRVVDVLGKLVAQFGANFVVALADVTVGSGETLQVGHRLNIPNDGVDHGVFNRRRRPSPYGRELPGMVQASSRSSQRQTYDVLDTDAAY
jgi:hypothetical protein